MPYATGSWGSQAQSRSQRRKRYFQEWQAKNRRPYCGQSIGYKGELIALNTLSGAVVDKQSSHDILWLGNKVEVKTASYADKYRFRGWKFQFKGAQLSLADSAFCVCLGEGGQVVAKYLLPIEEVKTQTLRISAIKDKYKDFKVK